MVNRTDLCILAVLHEQKADRFMVAMSIDEIIEVGVDDVSRITVYSHIKHLVLKGLVAKGAKSDRANCFYITEKGKAILYAEGEVKMDD